MLLTHGYLGWPFSVLNFHFITSMQGQGGHKWEGDNEPGHSSIDIKTHSKGAVIIYGRRRAVQIGGGAKN